MTLGTTILETRKGPLLDQGRPLIMGIVNVTPNSFSDGGRHLAPRDAIDCALRMQDEGADIIDLGAVSTRPGSSAPSESEELSRLLPVLEGLAGRLDLPLSIDTFRARVFEEAWERGAAILNDVTALRGDEELGPLAGRLEAPVVLMHMLGEPCTMQQDPGYTDLLGEIRDFLGERARFARRCGVAAKDIILDPGIGFGKTLEHNLEILRRLGELHELGHPLLLGASRKSFLGLLLDRTEPEEREYGTAATTAHAFQEGVQIVRVHDVRAASDLLQVLAQISRKRETTNLEEDS